MSHSETSSATHDIGLLGSIVRATQSSDVSPALRSSLTRRRFLLAGGATISFGALLAACGGNESSGIPVLGNAPQSTALPDAPVTDIALLRTATSLEYNAIFVYDAVTELVSGDAAILAQRFVRDHKAHAEATAALTEQLGGKAFEEPNPRLQRIYIEPALTAILGDSDKGIAPTDDAAADIVALAYALETLAGATYQAYVPLLNDKSLRAAAMGIGEQEARHAAVLGSIINPDRLVSSFGLPLSADFQETTDVPAAAYAVPSSFGTLAPIPLVIGAPNDSGGRMTVNLETPNLNSMVYEYLDN